MARIYHYQAQERTLLADLFTPVTAYLRLRNICKQSALMECSDYHDMGNSRSFIAVNPIGSVAVSHGMAICRYPDGSQTERAITDSYTCDQAIQEFINAFRIEGDTQNVCGLYGYTTFNAVRYFEHIAVKDETADQHDAPDIYYLLYRDVIAFDHYNNRAPLPRLSPANDAATAAGNGNEATAAANGTDAATTTSAPDELERFWADLKAGRLSAPAADRVGEQGFRRVGDTQSTLTDDEHRENIRRGIRHCQRGDVFQIVLSRRFTQQFEGDDFRLYRALRSINPSPYLFYFDFGGFRIFGSSPETHCRIAGQTAYIDPIAGTAKRTADAEADRRGAEFLRNDPKENAEHVMLVDLARNDLSRNCTGVKVDFFKDIQYYSHVIHLVSRVSGTLRPTAEPIKAFIDTFPAGTLSGAPKVRAMQLISEYEPHNRGAYGGCIGFIGMNGDLNQAITIRTFVSRNIEQEPSAQGEQCSSQGVQSGSLGEQHTKGMLWVQAGGGIVAKSDVEYELQEVNNKLGALRRAIIMAEQI